VIIDASRNGNASRPPLTVAEALRNIANQELERRARELSAQHNTDYSAAGLIINPFDESQQNRS
jgi:hypothetical protein